MDPVDVLDAFVLGGDVDALRDWIYADDRSAVLGSELFGELVNLDYGAPAATTYARRIVAAFHGEMWPGRIAALRARPLLEQLVALTGNDEAVYALCRELDRLGHGVDWVPAAGDARAHIVENARARLRALDE